MLQNSIQFKTERLISVKTVNNKKRGRAEQLIIDLLHMCFAIIRLITVKGLIPVPHVRFFRFMKF